MHDVIVVGGGPAGSLAAKSLAKSGYDIAVLEEHPEAGTPQHCTGLISEQTAEMSGIRPDRLNTLYGAEFIFPGGQSITIRSDKPKAVIVDRADMDRRMAEAAMDAGAEYKFSEKYLSHSLKDGVTVETDRGTYRSKAIVGADGASSKVALSLGDNWPKEFVRGIQADVRYRSDDQEIFKVYLGNKIAPGFFAWEIPCGGFTRIGLCTSWSVGPPSEYLTDLLIRLGLQDRVMKVYNGKIPLGGRPYLYGDRCLLAGDAAGFVKPLSGGGLYPTFKANRHLVETLTNALQLDSFTDTDLVKYVLACKEDFGKELERSYYLRKRFKRLSDSDFNKVYDFVIKNQLVSDLNDLDLDHPAESVRKLVSSPKIAISAIPIFLRSLR